MLSDKTGTNIQDLNMKTFEILVRQWHKSMIAYALSIVHRKDIAEDLVQDAFITAYENLYKFDTSRDFGKWVRGIIRNKYLEWIRKQQRAFTIKKEIIDAIDQQYNEWDSAMDDDKKDIFIALSHCLDSLEDIARKITDFFYVEKKSCTQISVHLNMTEVLVRKRLQRIRENLADCIQSKLGFAYKEAKG